jgi:predicted Zn-dependent protease
MPTPVAAAPTRSPAAHHLREVVQALRIDHAPRTALELLQRHAHELAGNAFAEEALLLRVEAMLALQQQRETLRLLDSTALANSPASSVLLLTRGQLRASANRCAEAIADFDLALARTLRPSKQALLGRAQCKQKLGDPKGAQADLDRVHREFPGEPGR